MIEICINKGGIKMKPVYKCEYCDKMGTKEEIKEHEEQCYYNYDRKSCWTCKHRDPKSLMRFKCLLEKEIPENFCKVFRSLKIQKI